MLSVRIWLTSGSSIYIRLKDYKAGEFGKWLLNTFNEKNEHGLKSKQYVSLGDYFVNINNIVLMKEVKSQEDK